MKDVSRGIIDSQGWGNENDLANSGETEQSFHGFGFIVDPGTKLARTSSIASNLFSFFPLFSLRGCPAEEPIAFRSARPRGLKYFHGEVEQEISLFMGKMEFARDPGRNNFDSRLCPVSREHALTLNKFPPTRNSDRIFSLSKRRIENEKSEICRGYRSRETDWFETIYKNDRFDGKVLFNWKEKNIFTRIFMRTEVIVIVTFLFLVNLNSISCDSYI